MRCYAPSSKLLRYSRVVVAIIGLMMKDFIICCLDFVIDEWGQGLLSLCCAVSNFCCLGDRSAVRCLGTDTMIKLGEKDRWVAVIENVRQKIGTERKVLCNRGRIFWIMQAFGKLSLGKMYATVINEFS